MSMFWFALGGMGWMASEYAIHRFVGHGPGRTLPSSLRERLTPAGLAAAFNTEHVAHHKNTSYFAPTSQKLLAASVALPALGAALSPVLGVRRAAAFAGGFALTYGAYEVLHRRIHTHAPRGPFGRWARRHHLLHHHKTPKLNHGVTSPLFDHLFGTHQGAERVRVPAAAAPRWLVDAKGEVLPRYQAEYEIVARRAQPVATAGT